jgi:plasmid stabilization system protein ParE
MTFSFHPAAEEEFRAAIEYYEDREPGLGYDFSVEVFTAIQNVVAHPHAWPVIEEDIHRCLVNRFPYCVLYAVEDAGIFMLAVMHLRRKPDYWKDRR